MQNISLPESPHHPGGCLLAHSARHHWTQIGSLSSRTWSKQVTVPGWGDVLPCFVATREGDLGWPQQQPCWAWLRMVSGCFQKLPFSEFGAEPPRTRLCGPPLRGRGARLRQPWGLQRALRKGLEEASLTTSQRTSQCKGRHSCPRCPGDRA